MHLDDERIHRRQHLVRLVDDQVGSLGDDLQLIVGDQGGDLDDHVLRRVEPGHLQIHPDQHRATGYVSQRGDQVRPPCPTRRWSPSSRSRSSDSIASCRYRVRHTPGDAGIDLVARTDLVLAAGGGRAMVPTGLALAIPSGHGGFVLPRSGLAARHGVTVVNAPGLIDAGFRDEVHVLLINTDPVEDYQVRRGDRIAQLVVLPVPRLVWVEVDRLDDHDRGGGFGHSGR